jgi:hypothetical protein
MMASMKVLLEGTIGVKHMACCVKEGKKIFVYYIFNSTRCAEAVLVLRTMK